MSTIKFNRASVPAMLPEDRPQHGKTSTTEYLSAGWTWEPPTMMRTVHLRVVDINDVQTFQMKKRGDVMENLAEVLLENDDNETVVMRAWGMKNIEKMLKDIEIGGIYKFCNLRVKDGGNYNLGTLNFTLQFGFGSYKTRHM